MVRLTPWIPRPPVNLTPFPWGILARPKTGTRNTGPAYNVYHARPNTHCCRSLQGWVVSVYQMCWKRPFLVTRIIVLKRLGNSRNADVNVKKGAGEVARS